MFTLLFPLSPVLCCCFLWQRKIRLRCFLLRGQDRAIDQICDLISQFQEPSQIVFFLSVFCFAVCTNSIVMSCPLVCFCLLVSKQCSWCILDDIADSEWIKPVLPDVPSLTRQYARSYVVCFQLFGVVLLPPMLTERVACWCHIMLEFWK